MTQLDLPAASRERHERFVQRVVASGIVWGLKDSDGWVTSSSTSDETEDRPIMPFWIPGMEGDGYLVGTNWNAHLTGHEIEPLQLLEEINACRAGAGR